MNKIENYLNFLPVKLDENKCNGCINCMKKCPTEAIRVREGKAKIINSLCVGCGECIRACPSRAKSAACDALSDISNYKYTIALPCPSIYGQFTNLVDVDYVLNGILALGFDEVYETALGYEMIFAATKSLIAQKKGAVPIISTTCPAIVKLVMSQYEGLLDNLSPFITPEEAVAKRAISEVMSKHNCARKDIGVFVISPCSANSFELKSAYMSQYIDGILGFSHIYTKLVNQMNKLKSIKKLSKAGKIGLYAGCSGIEARTCTDVRYLSADGISNCISVLNDLEGGKIYGLDFVELKACTSGCVGGCLNIENPFVARMRTRNLSSSLSENKIELTDEQLAELLSPHKAMSVGSLKLSNSHIDALRKMKKINEVWKKLPNLDCGSCGAPSCKAFAEDIVNGVKATCRFCGYKNLLGDTADED